jgi:hypothetical protein
VPTLRQESQLVTTSVIPVEFFGKRFNPHRLRRQSLDVLDYALFLPSIWLACSLALSLGIIGPLFVVIPIGTCLLYAILRRTVPPRLLSVYVAYCIFIAILSKYRLLPTSWQVYFIEEAIVRQLIPPLGFFAVAWASKAYFRRRLLCGDAFFGAPLILFLSFVVGPAVMYQQNVSYQGNSTESTILALYGALSNNITIAMFFVFGYIFFANDWRRYAALITFICIAVSTHFAQFRVLTVTAVAVLFGISGRLVVVGLVLALVGVYAAGIDFISSIRNINPNAGLRLSFVADALSSVIDTHGMGIGYGTESVRWQYRFPGMPVFTFLPDPRSITPEQMLEVLSTGVHNSFVQAMLRTGVLGAFLLVAAFFAAFPPPNLPRNMRNHAAVVLAMIFIACFVNPALESPVQVVGIGFVYGYLLACRAWAQTHKSSSVTVSSRHSRWAGLA